MSAPATIFGIYLILGLVLMTIVLASGRGRRHADLFDPGVTGDELSAGYLIFIALLWPIWLIAMLSKNK